MGLVRRSVTQTTQTTIRYESHSAAMAFRYVITGALKVKCGIGMINATNKLANY